MGDLRAKVGLVGLLSRLGFRWGSRLGARLGSRLGAGFGLAALTLFSSTALAWNESGHRVIAAHAAQQMSPEVLAQVVKVLKAHPRYRQDLAPYRPRDLKELSEAQWLLGQAAQWPDHARGFENEPRRKRDKLVGKYHHGNWHYINLPLYLATADQALKIKDPTKLPRKGGTLSADILKPADVKNVLEALNFMRAALGDASTTDRQKGLWVSWALHLIADVHQPLHTTAMFSRERWPRGDRGGNEVKIAGTEKKRGKTRRLDSLHYFWDSAITNRRRPGEIHALAAVLDEQLIGEVSEQDAQPVAWIRQGHTLAQQAVYGPLLAQITTAPVVRISTDYTQQTHAASLKQAALASRRTAIWLELAFSEPGAQE